MGHRELSPHALLSALWVFDMLTPYLRDLHGLGRPGLLEQVRSGRVDGVEVAEALMLAGGLMGVAPIVTALLSLVLRRGFARGLSRVFAPAVIAMTVRTNLTPNFDNLFFMGVWIAALPVALRVAWVWTAARRSRQPRAIIKAPVGGR